MLFKLDNLAQLDTFDSIIDARTPSEYALDHIPSSLNAPTMNDAERVLVGTTYKQLSAFEAKKRGAAIAARNIAMHIEQLFMDKPKDWQPLVYCWRGGNRSGSMVTILRAIGWRAQQLQGGHKHYRQLVVDALTRLPSQFHYQVIGGATGSGKTRLLHFLAQQGAQVLDLEALACHKGSIFGGLAHQPQPSQKWFDSQLIDVLRHFDPKQPIFVEAESKKIGQIHLPESLIEAIRRAPVWEIRLPMAERITYLLEDYANYVDHPDQLKQQMTYLLPLFGHTQLAHWQALIDNRQFSCLTEQLLTLHYDPLYLRALQKQTEQRKAHHILSLPNLSTETCLQVSQTLFNTTFEPVTPLRDLTHV